MILILLLARKAISRSRWAVFPWWIIWSGEGRVGSQIKELYNLYSPHLSNSLTFLGNLGLIKVYVEPLCIKDLSISTWKFSSCDWILLVLHRIWFLSFNFLGAVDSWNVHRLLKFFSMSERHWTCKSYFHPEYSRMGGQAAARHYF